jgi:glyoxylase-like metal-dependent hydrolase (beta-lactamase superfamily II)
MAPDWLTVIERRFPSCVMVVVGGPRPIVVDPGSLTDADQLPQLLAGIDLATVLCTHYHSDHVGAVAPLQDAGAQVAAHAWDAATINRRDQQACASKWLDQPVLPYRVDQALNEGDIVSTGAVDLHVIHTPGHTLGGISLWEPDSHTLICGDAMHECETPWIGTPHEGAGALQRAQITLDCIERLNPALIVSGHGAPITNPATAIETNRCRLTQWAEDPKACVMYAAKRIWTYRLMLEPIPSNQAKTKIRTAPWLRDMASSIDHDPDQLAAELLDALAPALTTSDGQLRTTAPHRRSPVRVPWHLTDTQHWT